MKRTDLNQTDLFPDVINVRKEGEGPLGPTQFTAKCLQYGSIDISCVYVRGEGVIEVFPAPELALSFLCEGNLKNVRPSLEY